MQAAIKTLPYPLQAFGHSLYAPEPTDEERETAESMVYGYACAKMGRMTAKKSDKARYVAAGVFFRYRHMVQGGQDGSRDPLASPERFRAWLYGEYGIELDSSAWKREWGGFVDHSFEACDLFDREALSPVARMIAETKERAA